MGGHIGLIFTKDHPERVDGLILTGSSGLFEESMGVLFQEEEIKTIFAQKQKKYFTTQKLQRMS